MPRVLLLVDDDAPIERSRLVDLAERGPAAGVHVLWTAPSVARLPAACRAFLEIDPLTGHGILADVAAGTTTPVVPEPLSAEDADAVARRLSPVVDASARHDALGDLSRSVSFLTLAARGE
jgi:S-DNA-T family DNA segregation ATPase FtsK/SpoIIIE